VVEGSDWFGEGEGKFGLYHMLVGTVRWGRGRDGMEDLLVS
jgi:hypothetical protein